MLRAHVLPHSERKPHLCMCKHVCLYTMHTQIFTHIHIHTFSSCSALTSSHTASANLIMYIYIYIYTYTSIHTHTRIGSLTDSNSHKHKAHACKQMHTRTFSTCSALTSSHTASANLSTANICPWVLTFAHSFDHFDHSSDHSHHLQTELQYHTPPRS